MMFMLMNTLHCVLFIQNIQLSKSNKRGLFNDSRITMKKMILKEEEINSAGPMKCQTNAYPAVIVDCTTFVVCIFLYT